MRLSWLVIPLACVLATAAAAQERTPSSPDRRAGRPAPTAALPVEVRTSVSKTAVWVGDQVTYEVEFRCAPRVDILSDDLAPERLRLDGLEVLGVEVERDASVPDRLTYRRRYRLATYKVDAQALSVGEISVRYFVLSPGQRMEDMVPSGEVRVPALTLALRSTLPGDSALLALRDSRAVQPLPRRLYLAHPVGLALVVLAIAPVGLWGVDLIRRARKSRSGRQRRQTRKQRRAALEDIKALDVSSDDALRNAYAQFDTWIRENVRLATGVPAAALTSSEITAAVPHPPRAVHVDQIQDVLGECERAKYAPDVPAADRWRAALEVGEQLLAADAR